MSARIRSMRESSPATSQSDSVSFERGDNNQEPETEDDEVEQAMAGKRRAATRNKRVIGDDDDEEEDEDEESESAAAQEIEADQEADELEEEEDKEGEELEPGDGDDYEDEEVTPVHKTSTRPSRRAAGKRATVKTTSKSNSNRKRKAETSDQSEEEESSVESEDLGSSNRTPKKITLRLSPEKKADKKSKKSGISTSNAGNTKTKSARVKASTSRRGKEIGSVANSEEEVASNVSSEDFENEAISLPKTARQLAKEKGDQADELVELPAEESKKQKLTENELALRRSEMARRRRNQSEKKLEDDKIETINRLLKKQVSRRSNKEKPVAGDDSDVEGSDVEPSRKRTPSPTAEQRKGAPLPLFRYLSRADSSTLSIPNLSTESSKDNEYLRKWDQSFKSKSKAPNTASATM